MMTTIARELAVGRPVILGTREVDGHVARMVLDRIDLGRRLARAVAPPAAPVGDRPGRSRERT
jgi:hypothetical protein